MADVSITITTTQLTRAKNAIGPLVNADGTPATDAELSDWLLRQVRDAVFRWSINAVAATSEAETRTELTTEGW